MLFNFIKNQNHLFGDNECIDVVSFTGMRNLHEILKEQNSNYYLITFFVVSNQTKNICNSIKFIIK